MCKEEEKYIESELEEGLRNNLFNPDNVAVEF
jgi:hypothetical protein